VILNFLRDENGIQAYNKRTMNPQTQAIVLAIILLAGGTGTTFAQTRASAVIEADKESFYTITIEDRATDIIKGLNLTNAATANTVQDLIVTRYRVLRARDVLINAQLKASEKEINYTNRADKLMAESKVLHDSFFGHLARLLTPEQIETVKDKLTYNKVKVTYDAYQSIIPGLTAAENAKILELLKAAREEAVDGGSSTEKSAIFQKYKDQIREYLIAAGHDVDKAFNDWAEKHPSTNSPAK
jgi:hypothetical protein